MSAERRKTAWETGGITPAGWEDGEVEEEVEYPNQGSQIPPPRDRDGALYEDEFEDGSGEWHPAVKRVASQFSNRTAGEVRFIKDRGGDKNEWGWGAPGPTKRELDSSFQFKPQKLKPLAMTLRASLMALGHALSAYQTFTKLKSATVSPDGALGGRGYIQKIAEMRRQYMNVAEALSAITDTLYDELHAPHWDPATEGQDPRERKQVTEIMQDVEEIRGDPEGWAEEEELELDAGDKGKKTARRLAKQAAQSEYVTDLSQLQIQRVTRAHLKKARVP